MAKYELRIKAREMRSHGESVRDIAKKLRVSKSTSSLWVRDIILSVEQFEVLKKKNIKGGELGRLKGSLMQKQHRLDVISKFEQEGSIEFKKLSRRELFVAGICLYWAEGSKKGNRFQFVNTDPKMIMLMINWLRQFVGVTTDDLTATVAINQIHKNRNFAIKKYWSEITGIPLEQFRKTCFLESKSKKVYANPEDYFGTIRISVLRSSQFCYKICGLIHGLAEAGGRLVFRGAS